MEKDNCILKIKELNKYFPGVHALKNVSINIKKGEVHSLVGENGAGKSTLVNCIFGVYEEDSGEMTFEG